MLINPTINDGDWLPFLDVKAAVYGGRRAPQDARSQLHDDIGDPYIELSRFARSQGATIAIEEASFADVFAGRVFSDSLRTIVGTGIGPLSGALSSTIGWRYEAEVPPMFAIDLQEVRAGSVDFNFRVFAEKNRLITVLLAISLGVGTLRTAQQLVIDTPAMIDAIPAILSKLEELKDISADTISEVHNSGGSIVAAGRLSIQRPDTLDGQFLRDYFLKKRDEDGWASAG